jgi:glucose-6-phosphate-specific signal transduction histidine kinase
LNGLNFKQVAATTPPRPSDRRHASTRGTLSDKSPEDLGKFLARELHDGVAQTLAVILLELQSLRRDQYGRAGALETIDTLEELTRSALADLRALLGELQEGQPAS